MAVKTKDIFGTMPSRASSRAIKSQNKFLKGISYPLAKSRTKKVFGGIKQVTNVDYFAKSVDKELSSFCTENEFDKIKSGNHTLAMIKSRGSGKWDKNELVRMLSPLQLEKVYSEGIGYSYVKVTSKHTNES